MPSSLMVIALSACLVYMTLLIAFDTMSTHSTMRNCLNMSGWRRYSSRMKVREAPNARKNEICTTPECIHTALRILKYMDPNVEPCNNFYKFACGGFLESTIVPDDKIQVDEISLLNEELKRQIRADMEEEIKDNEPKPFRLAKTSYKSCMNTTLIEEQGLDPLKRILSKLGGWPVLESNHWTESDFNWIKSVYKLEKLGYPANYFMSLVVDVDLKNSSQRIITLNQPRLSLSHEYLLEGFTNDFVKAYYNYMFDIAMMLGANETSVEVELKEVMELEIQLANISTSRKERRNITMLYEPMTIKELSSKYEFVPWKEYFNNLLPKSVQVDEDELILVPEPSFFLDLGPLLNITPKKVQANYIMWNVASHSASCLNEEIREVQWTYLKLRHGMTEREPRWKECVDMVSNFMGISVGAMYVRKHFKENAKENILEMVDEIRKQFRTILEKVDWMDNVTRARALEKADSMSTRIAYPDELLDDRKLEEFYAKLELSEGNYLESILNLTRFGSEYAFSTLRKPVNQSDWIGHGQSAMVNAFYSHIENSLTGILQGCFFNNERPRYMNYGAIGFVIGHEITHGFDDQGRQFDKNGNLVDWWAPKTKEQYLKKAKCIIEQYGNYTLKEVGLKLNGNKTQNENIADNIGLKGAHLSYKEWMKRNGQPEPQLPGLDYTGQQMFWISFAQMWCTKYHPKILKSRIASDEHSPGEFRVLGPMYNMEEFYRDFNCPLGSKMNPQRKCSLRN